MYFIIKNVKNTITIESRKKTFLHLYYTLLYSGPLHYHITEELIENAENREKACSGRTIYSRVVGEEHLFVGSDTEICQQLDDVVRLVDPVSYHVLVHQHTHSLTHRSASAITDAYV